MISTRATSPRTKEEVAAESALAREHTQTRTGAQAHTENTYTARLSQLHTRVAVVVHAMRPFLAPSLAAAANALLLLTSPLMAPTLVSCVDGAITPRHGSLTAPSSSTTDAAQGGKSGGAESAPPGAPRRSHAIKRGSRGTTSRTMRAMCVTLAASAPCHGARPGLGDPKSIVLQSPRGAPHGAYGSLRGDLCAQVRP